DGEPEVALVALLVRAHGAVDGPGDGLLPRGAGEVAGLVVVGDEPGPDEDGRHRGAPEDEEAGLLDPSARAAGRAAELLLDQRRERLALLLVRAEGERTHDAALGVEVGVEAGVALEGDHAVLALHHLARAGRPVRGEEVRLGAVGGLVAGGVGVDRDEELAAGAVRHPAPLVERDEPVVGAGVDDADAEAVLDEGPEAAGDPERDVLLANTVVGGAAVVAAVAGVDDDAVEPPVLLPHGRPRGAAA